MFPSNSNNSSIAVPVGSVISYAGKISPASSKPEEQPIGTILEVYGWMLCDSRELKIVEYPLLFTTLGYQYSKEDKGDHFNIPDFSSQGLIANNAKENNAINLIIKYADIA